jgi:hypothetical protein
MTIQRALFVLPVLASVLSLGSLGMACTPGSDQSTPSAPLPLPQRKTIAFEGEACTPGSTPRCADGLRCKEQPYTRPLLEGGTLHSPSDPSDVGGSCGGVAGFHCADGLDCTMAPDQEMVADGMGTCALHGLCVR